MMSIHRRVRLFLWAMVALTVLFIFTGVLVEITSLSAAVETTEGAAQSVPAATPHYLPVESAALENATIIAQKRAEDSGDWLGRLISIGGIFAFIGIAWLLSKHRRRVRWKLVAVGTTLQLLFALFILWTPLGRGIFASLNTAITALLNFTKAGTAFLLQSFVTGQIEPALANVAVDVLPTIIFFSSLMTVLYHLGVMQVMVRWMSVVMVRLMGTSGSETLSASANIFVGQTEAPLVIKPYVETMTRSELMAVMTGGFATVAGGVMAAYVALLSPFFPDIAGHLIAASVMSAPAALVIAKIMLPETESSPTMGSVKLVDDRPDVNVIDAAARGAGDGMRLALNVGAMLLAFIALVAMLNYAIGLPSRWHNNASLDEVNGFLLSTGQALPAGCDKADTGADILRCTHAAWLAVADHYHIEVPPDLTTLSGDESDKILRIEAAGTHIAARIPAQSPLEGTAIVGDCQQGRVAACGALLTLTQSETWTPSVRPPDLWPMLTLEFLLGWLFFPLAWLMGVPLADCQLVGQLLGEKMVLNEFIAYLHLADVVGDLHYRSIIICTYALCGFANFGSIAIQIGGIGGIAPARRQELAKLGMRAMIAGTIAAFMTATIAGALVT